MCMCPCRSRKRVQGEADAEAMGRVEAGMKQMEQSVQALADRLVESVQELRMEVAQESRHQAQSVEKLRSSVAAAHLSQAKAAQELEATKRAVEAALGELRAGVEERLRQHGDGIAGIDAKTGHAAEQAAASREHAEGMSARVDSVQSDIAGIGDHLRQLSASMEVVEGHAKTAAGAQWIPQCVKHVDTTLLTENAALAQQIEHLGEELRLAKELSGSNIQEELQRLFDELQEARADTARVRDHAQQARAQQDREVVSHHAELERLQEVIEGLRRECGQKDADYERLREEVAMRDMNIEWQREQTNLANLWLRQQPDCLKQAAPADPRRVPPLELTPELQQRRASSGGTDDGGEDPHCGVDTV
mmetsp:Transcript_37262/g.105190  ORF Transcript_37262/g.105190 Transcript_37262/m.105190 type:complete len:363 (+) Transcript_37262:70-1158(+)